MWIRNRMKHAGSAVLLAAAMLAGVGIAGTTSSADAAQRYYRDRYGRLHRVAPNYGYRSYPGYNSNYLDDRARQQGYIDGFERGSYDRSMGKRTPAPAGHGAYQYALNGWTREMGSTSLYRQFYRESFVQGYQDGFWGRGRR